MRILQLTPGTGNFHCGTCLRDHTLVKALGRLGHEATMAPLYLPLVLDTEDPDLIARRPMFGGINLYLQQKARLFRSTPIWLDRLFDSRRLLRWASQHTGMTKANDLGDITISILRGEQGRQVKELQKMIDWLVSQPRPDVVCLSNAMMVGMARQIKVQLGVPVGCTLQGEDTFVDSLPRFYRDQAWQTMAERARDIDGFIAISNYYADLMKQRLHLPTDRVHVVHNGIMLDGHDPANNPPDPPVLGYLAKLCSTKGLDTLVDAYLILKKSDRIKHLKLWIAGAMTRSEKPFVESITNRLRHAGVWHEVTISANLERAAKMLMLRSLTVFSVPATYGESFGLYVLEALASGVPVVQPRHGAFEELLGATGGGILCDPNDAQALAEAIEQLLLDEPKRQTLGDEGRRNVIERFSADRMAQQVAEVYQALGSGSAEAISHDV